MFLKNKNKLITLKTKYVQNISHSVGFMLSKLEIKI